MRPSTVPAGTCEPTLSCLMTIWSRAEAERARRRERAVDPAGAQELLLGAAGGRGVRRASGCANRRSLTGGSAGAAASSTAGSASLVARSTSFLRVAREAGRSVSDAAAFGFLSVGRLRPASA